MTTTPQIIVLAGPNGAGKSTAAAHLLPERFTFVNADEVAKGLPGYPSRAVDLLAGRLVLERMDELEAARRDFAVETTLASRSLAARVVRLRRSGYRFHLLFLWVPDAAFSVERVAERVALGGHDIPEETIRRRYVAGIRNFFTLYRPLADEWGLYINTALGERPRMIAEGIMGQDVQVHEPHLWRLVQSEVSDEGSRQGNPGEA